MRPVTFIIKEGDENLTSHSGPALIGALPSRTELSARLNAATLPGCREPKIKHSDIVKSMAGLLCLGKPDYDAIEAFREVPFFRHSPGNILPARLSGSGSMWSAGRLIGSSRKSRREGYQLNDISNLKYHFPRWASLVMPVILFQIKMNRPKTEF